MLDIPMFTTENGVASLTLSQIPYTKSAYIRIHDASDPAAFLNECSDFCRSAGAEAIYATGHPHIESYPLHCEIWQMSCSVDHLLNDDAFLYPVCDENAEQWREIYNDRMQRVANAAYMTKSEMKKILGNGSGYFIHRDSNLLGIGVAEGCDIHAVISTVKGAGYSVLCALAGVLSQDIARVEVASTNVPAIHLYKRAGFLKTNTVSAWYKIF